MAKRGRPLDPKIQEVGRKDGTTVYRVRVRVRGAQTTETFPGRAAARVFVENVKEFGADEAVAIRARSDPNDLAYVPTLAQMLDRHVEELTGVDKRTKDDYLAVARRSWRPTLGRYPVDALTRAHVAQWVNAEDGKVKPKTIKNAHSVLSAVLETCVREGLVPVNVARGTRLPRTGEETVEENRYLTYAEFERLLHVTPAHWQPFVILLFGTGLRFSEATALQVQDINVTHGTLRVMRAWKREAGAGIRLGPPKSKMSRRTIEIGPDIIETLRPLLDRPGSAFLFSTTTGRVVMHSNFYNRVWTPACKAAKLDPRPRVHDARHTHASWLIAQGARLEYVQERLGHEDYTTTRRVYAHLMPDMRAEGARIAAAVFGSVSLKQIES